MKKLLLFSLLIFMTSLSYAQTGLSGAITGQKTGTLVSGSLSGLKGEYIANFEIQYTSIMNMSEADFAKYETDWEKDKQEVLNLILERANMRGNKLALGNYPNAKYTVKAIVSINEKAAFDCECVVLTSDGTEVARISGIRGTGSNVGTKLQQIKSAAKTTGMLLGKALKKYIKQAK